MNTSIRNPRKSTNLSLDSELTAEAKSLGISLSRAAEQGIADAVRTEKQRQWKEENQEATKSYNEWVEKNGIPLEKHRLF